MSCLGRIYLDYRALINVEKDYKMNILQKFEAKQAEQLMAEKDIPDL